MQGNYILFVRFFAATLPMNENKPRIALLPHSGDFAILEYHPS
jgi:hypothetical protein